MNLENYISTEKVGNRLLYHFRCTNCGSDYARCNLGKNNGLCPSCRNAEAKRRAKITSENYREKAIVEVGADVKRIVRVLADKHTVSINDIDYVNKKAVIDGINDYFKQL